MESWNAILNTALLGTDKKALAKEDVEASLGEAFETVALNTADKEDNFLQAAALVYNVRRCGFLPLKKESLFLPPAEAEKREYASSVAHAVLNEVMDSGSLSLLQFWLEQCSAKGKIAQPEFLPLLFDAGVKTKALQPLVKAVCGKRGEWLTQFNEDWTWADATVDEELWQTGTPAQRKLYLATIRTADPAKARELLQQTWPQETAAVKAELLDVLLLRAGDEDVQWLEELDKEKSAKVKEAPLEVLKTIPSSRVVQSYWKVLQQSVKAVSSRGLLGTGAKTTLEINLSGVEPSLFKTGLQQLPPDKKTPEDVFVLQQLIAAVPPHFWEDHLQADRKKIVELFSKADRTFPAALGKAAARFRNVDWLRTITAYEDETFYADALQLFPQTEAEDHAAKFLADDRESFGIIQAARGFEEEWSVEFAKAFLRAAAKNPYHYHRGFFNDMVHLLPLSAVDELEKCRPKEEHLATMWSNLREHIARLLAIKQQAVKAFNE